MQEYSRQLIGRFFGLDQKRKGAELTYKPNGKWDHVAEDMMRIFSESGVDLPYFVDIQCFGTRIFAKQRERNIVFQFLW